MLQSFEFMDEYRSVLMAAEQESKLVKSLPLRPRTFQESEKSKKTIDSMVERKGWLFNTSSTEPETKKKKKKGDYSLLLNV